MLRKSFFVISFFALSISGPLYASFIPKSFKAQIEQSYKSKVTGREKKNSGEIQYFYPGHIKIEIQGAQSSLFVGNPKKAWLYRPPFNKEEGGEVTIIKSEEHFLAKIFDLLTVGLGSNSYYKVTKGDDSATLTLLPPHASKWNVSAVILLFGVKKDYKFNSLKVIRVHYQDRKKIDFKIINTEIAKNLTPKDFVFRIPDRAKVTIK